MSLVKPKGVFKWDKSVATDVVQYNLYAKPADSGGNTQMTPEDLKFTVPAVIDQANYSLNLADIPGLLGANGEQWGFAVASQDASGNVSDFSPVQLVTLDETAPDTPPNFTFSAE